MVVDKRLIREAGTNRAECVAQCLYFHFILLRVPIDAYCASSLKLRANIVIHIYGLPIARIVFNANMPSTENDPTIR